MKRTVIALVLGTALTMTACNVDGGGGDGGDAGAAAGKRGPITIWYSNNTEEVAWGKSVVSAWNAAHPDEKVTAQEIPAGKTSEETIGAAITAGNAPCLVLNTSPAAVPQFQKQGGLVPLDDFADGTRATSRNAPASRRSSTSRRTASSTSCRGSPTRW